MCKQLRKEKVILISIIGSMEYQPTEKPAEGVETKLEVSIGDDGLIVESIPLSKILDEHKEEIDKQIKGLKGEEFENIFELGNIWGEEMYYYNCLKEG